MRKSPKVLASWLIVAATACGPTSNLTQSSEEAEASYVGGWDGAETRGNSVLLLRDDLRGTLTSSTFGDGLVDYRMSYEVVGEVEPETNMLALRLQCSDGSQAAVVSDPPPGDDTTPPTWVAIDCTGWELALDCSLAGDCHSGGGCNLVCDIVDFGDSYALSGLALRDVEAEFDHWERV